jgi:hypothetical protein
MTRRFLLPSARWITALATLVAGLVALTAPAHASKTQESIFQDDRLLLNYGLGAQRDTLNQLQLLGVDTVHAVVNWNSLAPAATSGSVPKGVDLTDPASYDPDRWTTIDQLVRATRDRGMGLILTPAAPAPNWAIGKDCATSEKRRAPRGTCRPQAKLYGDFVTALAKRYSGFYPDPNQLVDPTVPPGTNLPKVSRWSLWNEPNLSSWIYPSMVKIRGKRVPISAKIYRDLVYAGGDALRNNLHSDDQILLGETGPLGQGIARTPPADFYRALFCIDNKGKRLTGSAAKHVGCTKTIARLPVTGVAHHPYTKGAAQDLTAKQHSTDITIANIPLLRRVLAQGAHAKAISSSAASQILFTEFGVSSTPPAKPRSYGVPLSKQAEYINEAEYMAYVNPAVRAIAQFQMEDDRYAAGSAGGKLTFQTGLRFAATKSQLALGQPGEPKPSFIAYKVPLFVVDRGPKLTIWGGVRGASTGRVKVLNGSRKVKTVKLRSGYFITTVKRRSGTWQLDYKGAVSRVAKPVKMK